MDEETREALRAALLDHEAAVLRWAAAKVYGGLKERNERRADMERRREVIIDDFGALVEAARKEGGENG